MLFRSVCLRPLKRDAGYWDASDGRRGTLKLLAAGTLTLWTGIIFAGRWIAYL